jgi:hypothetical protein
MSRYFTRPTVKSRLTVEDDDWWPEPPAPNLPTVCDHEAVDTGLLDVNGDTIMRAPNPCGFGKDDEW